MLAKITRSLSPVLCLVALAVSVLLGGSPAFATDTPIVLPSTGIDLAGSATGFLTAVGLVMAAGVGIALAIVVVRIGLKWMLSGAKK